jgi:hypothetical protein
LTIFLFTAKRLTSKKEAKLARKTYPDLKLHKDAEMCDEANASEFPTVRHQSQVRHGHPGDPKTLKLLRAVGPRVARFSGRYSAK